MCHERTRDTSIMSIYMYAVYVTSNYIVRSKGDFETAVIMAQYDCFKFCIII